MQLLLTLFFYWLIFFPFSSAEFYDENDPGNRLAIHIDSGGNFFPTADQFALARSMGIDLIEISNPALLDAATLRDFYILLSSGNRYVTYHRLRTSANELITQTELQYGDLPSQIRDRVAAVSILRHPAFNTERYIAAIADSLSQVINKPLYYESARYQVQTQPDALSFASAFYRAVGAVAVNADQPQPPVLYFFPAPGDQRTSVQHLETILNKSFEHSSSIVILPADWFFQTLDLQPDLGILLASYTRGETVTLPLPAEATPAPLINWHVILLLIMFTVLMFHYKNQPSFLSFTVRYYFNHSFFVADLFEGRVRNKSSGLTILGLHGFAAGLVFYIVAGTLFNSHGFSVLGYHFPYLFIDGFEAYTFFGLGLLIGLLSHLVSVFWILVLNKKVTHTVQPVNLYAWPLLINILIIFFLVIFKEAGASGPVIYTLAVMFMLVWFFSFNIAAIDASRYLDKLPLWNLSLTVGLHFLLLLATILVILFIPDIFEPIKLAHSLS